MASYRNRVFISYAWENRRYCERVKSFAARLRENGVNARLDAWHLNGQTIPEFMASEVRNAGKILVLCSPSYRAKVHAMEDGNAVSGSGWEAMLVTSAIWTSHRTRDQIVAILFQGTWRESSPDFLSALPYIDLTDETRFEAGYVELLRRLTDQHEQPPPLGDPPAFSPIVTTPLRGLTPVGENQIRSHGILVSNAVIPKQLPPPPSTFVGRATATTRLVNAVRKADARTLAIHGTGGIGKTALALAVAKELASDFPAGQIYLDLKGARHKNDSIGSRPLTSAEIMDHIIRSFDPMAPAFISRRRARGTL